MVVLCVLFLSFLPHAEKGSAADVKEKKWYLHQFHPTSSTIHSLTALVVVNSCTQPWVLLLVGLFFVHCSLFLVIAPGSWASKNYLRKKRERVRVASASSSCRKVWHWWSGVQPAVECWPTLFMLNAEMKEYKTRVGVIPSTSTHQPVPSTPQHTTVLSVVRTITMIQQQEQQQQPRTETMNKW